jgi:hypothetical protein
LACNFAPKYRLTITKRPLAKELAGFEVVGTSIVEARVRELATGTFLAQQRNAVLGWEQARPVSLCPTPESASAELGPVREPARGRGPRLPDASPISSPALIS